MKLCYSWLKELADFEWDAHELADRLSLSGTEANVIGPLFPGFSGVVVGKVDECEPHSSSNKLKVCKVDTGSTVLTTLCGAPNIAAGQKVAFAGPGAKLPNGISIQSVERLGTKSDGMICSEAELGLSDDHSVIMELDRQFRIGASVREALEIDDWLIEFDLTPNRPDCLCAIGIAREIAAMTGTKMNLPEIDLEEIESVASGEVEIEIDNPDQCPRYMARVIRGVRIGSSPWWIRKKIYSTGMRSINAVVDITNLVMMETGHPLHAFDFDLFSVPKVLVRNAREGEKFTTLDKAERSLSDDTVLITDSVKTVAIGGIMGGLESEVGDATENILLESAYFDPTSIRRARRHLGLTTESQVRFEKGADPNNVPKACDRAAYLMQKYTGGKVFQGQVDCYPKAIEPVRINLRPTRVNQILATDLATPQMIDILSALEFGVRTGKQLEVIVPTFRPDVTREIDLIEEIARIYGLDRIKSADNAAGRLVTTERPEARFHEMIRELLTSRGCAEALTNTLIDPAKDKVVSGLENHIRMLNPVSVELSVMRQNLQCSLLNIVSYNLNRRKEDILFFEIGRVFLPSDAELPLEKDMLALAVAGKEETINWDTEIHKYDFFDLKGVLEALTDGLRVGYLSLEPAEYPFYEKGRSFDVILGGTKCGFCGEVSKKARDQFDIDCPVFTAELDMIILRELASDSREFIPVPKFPSSVRDIAVVVDADVPAEQLRTEIMSAGGELVRRVDLFDIYEGKQVPAGKKSLAFSLEYRSDDKTLTDEEIDVTHKRVIERLGKKFSAELRS